MRVLPICRFLHKGKTHPSQTYERECCLRGLKTYYIKASELRDRLAAAARKGNASRVVGSLVKPSCPVIDEVGRCEFDKASVFMMSGPSYRGRELDTYSVEAVPEAIKTRGIQPIAP